MQFFLKKELFLDTAGLILNDSIHYLDHLAPFCALNNWPLILSEPSLALLAKTYYPDLKIVQQSWNHLALPEHIVSCHPRPLLESCFLPSKTSWLPHGNSDKGWKSEVFEHLVHEEKIYVYGSKMIDAIQEKAKKLPKFEIISNFRKSYFTKHQDFYRELTQKKFPTNPKTIKLLYAPTWADFEKSCSFWQAFPILAKNLPDHYTLLIKLHPNTELSFAAEIERLIGQNASNANIIWIHDFPPIYPLIDLADGYIGDMSSIGYDFLSKNRPMYFLNSQKRDAAQDPGLYLYRCGIELSPEDYPHLFSIDERTRKEDAQKFTAIRKQVYDYTFF